MNEPEMRELARQERNRYLREWRAKNKDKVRETNQKYWERRAARLASEKEVHRVAENADN